MKRPTRRKLVVALLSSSDSLNALRARVNCSSKGLTQGVGPPGPVTSVASGGFRAAQPNHDPELKQVGGGDFSVARAAARFGDLHKNRGTGSRAGHGCRHLLKHQQAVGDTDAEGAAGTPLRRSRWAMTEPAGETSPRRLTAIRLSPALAPLQHTRIAPGSIDES